MKIWDTDTIVLFKTLGEHEQLDEFDRLLPPESQRRALCSMSRHNGVVTSVKFSPDGRFLASGSDDKIVLIWEKDELMSNRPKQFGEAEADLEHWTVRKRLVAHENDIQDICWSPDGLLLVTVGLDRLIMIWSGTTFERIKRYDIHQSMVKGVVFDPANKFFATASDDRTVRIFRYSKKLHELVNNYEFQMEHVVFDPFKKSPLTSYFRRMSWSPDGQNIAVPNATNGPVPSVAIIKRGNWSTDISLIGHEAPCEVCSFSPKFFQHDDANSNGNKEDDFYTILATGGQDRNLAIWSTSQSKPLVVAQDIAHSSITDICWNTDGNTLFFSCLDGTITCVGFEKNELGNAVSSELVNSQLHKYGRDHDTNVFPESIQQLKLEEQAEKSLVDNKANKPKLNTPQPIAEQPIAVPEAKKSATPPVSNGSPHNKADSKLPQLKLTQNITTKNGKKRVAPMLISSLSHRPETTPELPINKNLKKFKPNSKVSYTSYLLPRLGVTTAVHGTKKRLLDQSADINIENNEDQDNDNEDMAIDLPTDGTSNNNLSAATLKKQKNKFKKQILEARYPNQFKLISNLSESLFNHSSLIQYEMSQIINAHDFEAIADLFSSTSATADTNDEDIIFAVLVAGIYHRENPSYNIKECNDNINDVHNNNTDKSIRSTIEVRNGPSWQEDEEDLDLLSNGRNDFQDPTVVIVTNNVDIDKRKYVMYFPFKIQHALAIVIEGILHYYALVSFDGTLQIIIAESGTLLCPCIELGYNLVCLKQNDKFLMGVTSSGLIYVWKLPEFPKERMLKKVVAEVSLSLILNCNLVIETIPGNNGKGLSGEKLISPNVRSLEIEPQTGEPFAIMSDTNDVYKYSLGLKCWTKVIDSWYLNAVCDEVKSLNKNSILDYFYYLSTNGFLEDVNRAKKGRYIFTRQTHELETVMKQRFNELMNIEL